MFTWVLFAAELHGIINAASPSSDRLLRVSPDTCSKTNLHCFENTDFEENDGIEKNFFQEENANKYIVSD